MKKTTLLFVSLVLFRFSVFSQNIGINTSGNAADNSALLDVSGTKGMLIPRMTTAERNAIASPAESLLIYNTDTKCFEAYNSNTSSWVAFGCIGCQLPGSFSASAAISVTSTSFSANWSASSGATAYYLDVSTSSTFASFVTDYNNLSVGNVTTYSVNTNLTCNTTYYYRVRANNACGTSANSGTISQLTSSCFTCGTSTVNDVDGNTYNTVLIGAQCWLKENLKTGTYVAIVSGGQTNNGVIEKYCQNLSGVNDNTCPLGGLYEWGEAVKYKDGASNTTSPTPAFSGNVQGICPTGWHLPTDAEWCTMENTVEAGTDAGCNLTGWRGTNTGGDMKVTTICGSLPCWNAPNTGATNSSNFTAVPGGKSWSGAFSFAGGNGYWWTAAELNATDARSRVLTSNSAQVNRNASNKAEGSNVRCVKD